MPSPTIILAILLGLSVLANGVLSKLYVGAREDVARVTQAFDSFKATVKVLGEEAAKKAKATKEADEKRKKETDDEHAKKVAGLQSDIKRLRDNRSRPGGDLLPAAPAGTNRPEIAAFNRAELDRAIRGFEAGVEGLLIEGATAVVDLDAAKRWAQGP